MSVFFSSLSVKVSTAVLSSGFVNFNRSDATRRSAWYLLVLVSSFIWSTPRKNPRTVLFILYVNDISSGISSTVKLYADDTKVYREISDIARDTSILQSDLFHLRNWSEVWQVNFNAKKCEIMRVTHNWINLSHITPSSRVENV